MTSSVSDDLIVVATPKPPPPPPPQPPPQLNIQFQHPGNVVSRGILDFVKDRIANGAEPWTSAYNAFTSDYLTSATYRPLPPPPY